MPSLQSYKPHPIVYLIIAMIAVQSCNSLLYLPVFQSKLQVFEMLSIPVMTLGLFRFISPRLFFKFTLLDIALGILVIAIVLSVALNYNRTAFFEALGSCYLFIFYFLFSRIFASFNREDRIFILSQGAKFGILVAAAGAWLGLFVYQLFSFPDFIVVYDNYPYLGKVLRLTGFSSSPNVLLSVMFTCLLIYYFTAGKRSWIILGIGIITCLFTLSKELFIYSWAALVIFLYVRKKLTLRFCLITAPAIACIYLLLVYFTFDTGKKQLLVHRDNPLVLSEAPVYQFGNVNIYATTYFYLMTNELQVIKETFPIGCGKGNFIQRVEENKKAKLYPEGMYANEPHDIYAGFIAECGLPALIALLFLPVAIWLQSRSLIKNYAGDKLVVFLNILLLCWAIESMALGTLQLRHYWVVLAIWNGLYISAKRELDTVNANRIP